MARILPALHKTQTIKKWHVEKNKMLVFKKTYMKGMDIIKKNMTS